MLTEQTVSFREASLEEDSLVAQHLYHMWRDNNVAADSIASNWRDITLEFTQEAREKLNYKAFLAEIDGVVVGSTSCQIFQGLYPNILKNRQYGYIWGVYVEPPYRGQGIAKKLVSLAIAHLKAIGCMSAILHASPSGKPVYTSLGFSDANEMQLGL